MKNFKNFLGYIICVTMILANFNIVKAEQLVASFNGISNANEIITNVDFVDVKSKPNDYWAKDAIYKMAGLGIVKGYGEKNFNPSSNISKAELLTLIYRALGKEEDSQKELEKFRKDTVLEISNRNLNSIWAEGYLLLAKNDGLITDLEFYQSIMPNTYVLQDGKVFDPSDKVTRQQASVWIAKAFDIEPVYAQNEVFNSFKDWESINYENIPYVEALLNQNIMNGDNGYFYPNHILKRDEVTQIMSNIEDKIYEINGYNKMYGYVEDISLLDDLKIGEDVQTKTIFVRGEDGTLNSINLSAQVDTFNPSTKEIANHKNNYSKNEVIVNKDGTLGTSNLLRKNDTLLIIYDNDNIIKFIQAKSDPNYETSGYGTIRGVDLANNKISFENTGGITKNYTLSGGAVISIDKIGMGIEDIRVGDRAYIIAHNDIATYIEISESIYNENPNSDEGQNDVRGIVKEVNSNLNYISLYGKKGEKDLVNIRTYNFSKNVNVKKDGETVQVKDIDVGDTVYLQINDNNIVQLINAKSNAYIVYGQVYSLGQNFVIVKYDDGIMQKFDVHDNTLIYKNGQISSKNDILAGDKLKITLSSNDSNAKLKDITIQEENYLVENIYKGQVFEINKNQIIIYNTKVFDDSKWKVKDQKGYIKFDLDNSAEIYLEDEKISASYWYSSLQNKEVYIATINEYGQNEKVLKVIVLDGHEKLYNDYVSYNYNSNKSIQLENATEDIAYSDATIVIRYGRLTLGSNIKKDDPIYMIGLRDSKTNLVTASVIKVAEKPSIVGIDLYRGRISSIDEGNNFIVNSFSKLIGYEWSYQNTPKTFEINNETYIKNNLGIVNNRDFVDYGPNSYKNKEVYIAAKGTLVIEISDAPFTGEYNIRGEIFDVNSTNSSNAIIALQNVTARNNTSGVWSYVGEDSINVYNNSIIIKNMQLCNIEDLQKGDKIRVLMNSNLPKGTASIILVED